MTLTDEVILPSDEELSQRDIPLSSNFLFASAMWLGKYCDKQSKDFMLCRKEIMDPRKCLKYGNELTECGIEFFKSVKKTCADELTWYNKCLEFSNYQPQLNKCRREQALWDGCMYQNGFERAKFGHFQLIRVHEPEWELPKKHVPLFPDSVETPDYYNPEHRKPPPRGTAGKMWAQTFIMDD